MIALTTGVVTVYVSNKLLSSLSLQCLPVVSPKDYQEVTCVHNAAINGASIV
jgi:hypothetical protein